MTILEEQQLICQKQGVKMLIPKVEEKLGIALSTIGETPINGVRCVVENGTCGWYVWCGEELSNDPDFYKPLHVSHIQEHLPSIEKYLALPVGYRFLISNDYEDIWFDETIENV